MYNFTLIIFIVRTHDEQEPKLLFNVRKVKYRSTGQNEVRASLWGSDPYLCLCQLQLQKWWRGKFDAASGVSRYKWSNSNSCSNFEKNCTTQLNGRPKKVWRISTINVERLNGWITLLLAYSPCERGRGITVLRPYPPCACARWITTSPCLFNVRAHVE